ncbi:hypothetical protein [Curtobacterium sp. MCBD17_013]|uniref:hypothetical protein n=1 Tax=Curtobacterium sp. MCBD17_013 TaxID=2175668 RepID=UPI000DAA5CAD|nr:hypothetical protein [Curtobacterium sp. MCBD17_013]
MSAEASRASRSFPHVGRALPAWVLTALGVVAGLGGAWVAVGPSGWWFALAVALVAASAVFPRGPFTAGLVVQLAVAAVAGGAGAGWGPLAVVLLSTHLIVAVGMVASVVPRRALVQLRALRPSALRFVAVQAGTQLVAAVVRLVGVRGGADDGITWIAVLAAVAIVAVAVAVLVPALGGSRRSSDG